MRLAAKKAIIREITIDIVIRVVGRGWRSDVNAASRTGITWRSR